MDTRTVIDRFLAGKRLALVGVSRDPKDLSRALFTELLKRGYEVFAVHPGVSDIEGKKVYDRIQDVPGPLDGAIVMTSPATAAQIARDCVEAHVPRVWLHRGIGAGAVSAEAVKVCVEHGIEVVPGECPFMFLGGPGHDTHRSMRAFFGRLPLAEAELAAAARANRILLAALVVLELFVAAGAFYGGSALLADPAGHPMGMPLPSEMAGFSFQSYLVPGVILLIANGVLPLFIVLGALTGRSYSVRGHMVVGMVLTGWIAVQVMMLGWISSFQPVMLVTGIAIFALGWLFQARKLGPARRLAVVG